jgi:hypothetical protein
METSPILPCLAQRKVEQRQLIDNMIKKTISI